MMYSSWLALPMQTRQIIAEKFGIEKTGQTHVDSNVIVSDGYKIQDIELALNIPAIQDYLGVTSTDLGILFDLLVARIEGRENAIVEEAKEIQEETIVPEAPVETPIEAPIKKKLGRPKKI